MSTSNTYTVLTEPSNGIARVVAPSFRFQTWTAGITDATPLATALANNTSTVLTIGQANVGIGSTIPAFPLDLNTNVANFRMKNGAWYQSADGKDRFYYQTNSNTLYKTEGDYFWQSSSGANIGVMTNAGAFTVVGDITAFGTVSDERYKVNVADLATNTLRTIQQLRPVDFVWSETVFNESKRGTADVGFIAQEVEPVLPKVVRHIQIPGVDNEIMGIAYDKLTPYLVKAVQELTAKVDALESKVSSLTL